jgi:zinc transport system ATP-binding protein
MTVASPVPPPPVLQAHRVGVTLGGAALLRDVSLEIAAGEVVAVLGSNGAGKSTLIRTAVGLVAPTSGEMRLYGADVTGPARAVPWQRIGYVPQRVGATGGVPATAAEVVTSGLLHRRCLRPRRNARRRCLAALDQVRLGARAHESVQVFSGGQQQRVIIACALVREPDLLILDEPLSGMDRDSMEDLAATLAGLRQQGVTVVVVLHELGPLAPVVTRTVVLHGGQVVHDGPHSSPEGRGADLVDAHPHPAAPLSIPTVPDLQREW